MTKALDVLGRYSDTPAPTEPAAAADPPAPPTDLGRLLDELGAKQQEALGRLIAELRRCEEIGAALPPGLLPQDLVERRREHTAAILGILKGWHALGGTFRLAPPPAPEPLPAPEPIPFPVAAPPDAPAPAPAPPPPDPEPLAEEPAPRPAPAPERPRTPLAAAAEPPSVPPAVPARDWAEDLDALLAAIRITGDARDDMEAIQRAANASFTRWANYPRTVQRALVGNLACRLRHLQDHLGITGIKLDSAFRSLTRFSKSFQPGWVNGLTRGRGPAAESWAEEGRRWWDQLVLSAQRDEHGAAAVPRELAPDRDEAIAAVGSWLAEWRQAPQVAKPMCMEKTLAAIQAAVDGGVPPHDEALCHLAGEIYDHLELPRFRRLRQAIRDLELCEREERGQAPPEPPPADWAWWSHTVGRRALLLAPEADQDLLDRIEQVFGLAALRWRRVDELGAESDPLPGLIASWSPDLVVLGGEDPDDAALRAMIRACQVRGLPWVHVGPGLGVTRLRMGIERFLHPDPRGEPGEEPEA